MDEGIREMARRCYGYGRWDAPYWFIGLEQGQAPSENNDLKPRVKAWLDLGCHELSDCREFHHRIQEKRWHREKPPLQLTWRRLMLLLMAFLKRNTDKESLRNYQRDRWGRLSGGETCVIELSGLAARNFRVPRDRRLFRQERIDVIRQRMLTYRPALVVMYGRSEKEDFEKIAGCSFPAGNILKRGSTIIAFTPQPTARGQRDAWWAALGERLRQEASPP
jgi:hypothetical protein